MIPEVSDIHTHNPDASADAVINLEPGRELRPGRLYSVGWHPWWPAPADMEWVERMAVEPAVVMIGECGIDRVRSSFSLREQEELTRLHGLLAERTGKPLILHVVRAWQEIIALRRELRPVQPWIIHGFRGKPQLASDLLRAGFHISLGPVYNPATLAVIPSDRLLRETD